MLRRAARFLLARGDPDEARAGPLADGLLAALLGTMAANVFYLTMQFYYFYALVLVIVTAAELYAPAPAPKTAPAPVPVRAARSPARVRPDVSVVIVAHGGGELVRRAIRAVEHDPAPPTREIIVVDSGRPDGPAAWLRAERPDIVLIELGENLGFGAANNRGIERSTGRYVLLLNPDAFVDEGCVGELVRFLETHPTAVAVGPRLRFGDGRLQRSCRGFPSVYRVATEYLGLRTLRRRSPALNSFYCAGFAHDEARHVDWLTGACLLVRGAPLRGAGGFDEAFFLYSEEVDLLRRLADQGGETWFDPAAGAVHLWGGVTSNDPGPGLPRAAAQPRALPAQALGPRGGEGRAARAARGPRAARPAQPRLPAGAALARRARRRRAAGRRLTRPSLRYLP